MDTLLLIGLAIIQLVIIVILLTRRQQPGAEGLGRSVEELNSALGRIESGLKEDFKISREEIAKTAKDNRQELNETMKLMTDQNRLSMKEINATLTERIDALIRKIDENNRLSRDELTTTLKGFQDAFDKNVLAFNNLQREKFDQIDRRQEKLIESTEKRLEEMRVTVDEKLQKTLNDRLSQSVEQVGKQLESVQKGLGEMQTIASDVGGLKKVLSNVKLRGGVGEVQLAMILEQILAPSQYEANICTREGSSDPVEFAIKLPGKGEDEGQVVYLPIDAKFPKDIYEHLLNAYDSAVPEEIESATKHLEATIKKMAKDIRDKYVDPPATTDFAIMFLPFESIYAEVIRRSALVDQLRDEFKITVAGPTTLVAILNSLQMGFRTLALQKRSSEVWKVLGAVKTEFEKFGGLLEKTQKNRHAASDQVDELLGKRSRAISRKLRNVEALPAAEANQMIGTGGEEAEEE